MIKNIKGISDIINKYETFILDQWGVMHDGTFGYEHAFNSINILNSNNKNLFIISNSSKRSKSSIDNLPKLGFKKKNDWYGIQSDDFDNNGFSGLIRRYNYQSKVNQSI